jgi:hypothetical protein
MPMRQQSATALIPTRSAMVWTLGIGGPALITRCGGARRDDDGTTFDTGEIQPDATSNPVKFEKEGGHFVCGGFDDVASMGLLENWIDEADRRVWFLFECGRKG